MALREFWIGVRVAARLPAPQAVVDSPRLDGKRSSRVLRRSTLWLTPARSPDSTRTISRSSLSPSERVWRNS